MAEDFLSLIQEVQAQAETEDQPPTPPPAPEPEPEPESDFTSFFSSANSTPAPVSKSEPEPADEPKKEDIVLEPVEPPASTAPKADTKPVLSEPEPLVLEPELKPEPVVEKPVASTPPSPEPMKDTSQAFGFSNSDSSSSSFMSSGDYVDVKTVSKVIGVDREVRKMSDDEKEVLSKLTANGAPAKSYEAVICNIVNVDKYVVDSSELIVKLSGLDLDERAFTVMSLSEKSRNDLSKVLTLFSSSKFDSGSDIIALSRKIVQTISSMDATVISNIKASVKLLKAL